LSVFFFIRIDNYYLNSSFLIDLKFLYIIFKLIQITSKQQFTYLLISQSQGGSNHEDDKLKVDCNLIFITFQSLDDEAQKDNQNIIIQYSYQSTSEFQDANDVFLKQEKQVNDDASEDKQNIINKSQQKKLENRHQSIDEQGYQETSNHYDEPVKI
ncbi:hypothetical protein pb186bvf_014250, partial [Paramecium bursaria]